MPTLSSLLDRVDWDDLRNGCSGRFHGDFHFENTRIALKKIYIFDWRQDLVEIKKSRYLL